MWQRLGRGGIPVVANDSGGWVDLALYQVAVVSRGIGLRRKSLTDLQYLHTPITMPASLCARRHVTITQLPHKSGRQVNSKNRDGRRTSAYGCSTSPIHVNHGIMVSNRQEAKCELKGPCLSRNGKTSLLPKSGSRSGHDATLTILFAAISAGGMLTAL